MVVKTLVSRDWSGLWPIKSLVNVSFGFQSSYIRTEFFKLSSTGESPTNFFLCCLWMWFATHSFSYFAVLLGSLNRSARSCFVFTKRVQLNERKDGKIKIVEKLRNVCSLKRFARSWIIWWTRMHVVLGGEAFQHISCFFPHEKNCAYQPNEILSNCTDRFIFTVKILPIVIVISGCSFLPYAIFPV